MVRLSLVVTALVASLACTGGTTTPSTGGGGSDPFLAVQTELAQCQETAGDTTMDADGLRIADAFLDDPLEPGGTAPLSVALAEVDGLANMNYPTATVRSLDPRLEVVGQPNAVWLYGIMGCETHWGSTQLAASASLSSGDTVAVEIFVADGTHSVELDLVVD